MSDSAVRVEPNVATQAPTRVGDAVWNYMVKVKSVRKRSGEEQPFQPEKLHNSIAKALSSAGVRDTAIADRVTGHVVTRLGRVFDGHTIPSTTDIRELVGLTLIDNNLAFVSKTYIGYRTGLTTTRSAGETYGRGLTFSRHFSKAGVHPFDEIIWETRDAKIANEKGETVFEQKGIEVPAAWSQTATNIVVSKYFTGQVEQPGRECSVKQLITRVAKTISDWGRKDGYFATPEDAAVYEDELTHILVTQKAAFNSPVWFNVGVNPHPQCSACFINSVKDDMRSIMNLAVTESMLFKGGSGTGTNLSTLRSKSEYLGGSNGKASGPVSFMKGFDAFAGVIKSGGKTRRAAKMVVLNIDHPDIEEFITCKMEEEKKAWVLMDAGYDGSIDGSAYSSIYFQNANNSVRVTDDFMRAVEADGDWTTHEVTTGKPSATYKARRLMNLIAEATWQCGDPGMQYDTTANRWHTCRNSGRINASNPCSEYMFLDDSACNLASLNLLNFRKSVNGRPVFDVEAFKKANEIVITAMDIIVGNASYPTPAIEQNALEFRTLGIGYANLGALLMGFGLAYDSDEGRNLAAAITSVMSGTCYAQSARLAEKLGTFNGFEKNREPLLEVMGMHCDAAQAIKPDGVSADLFSEAKAVWQRVLELGGRHGMRNAQISVLAPTGTIAFLMDCDTTGIEPDIALVKYKWLVGGGLMKIVNKTVPEALDRLGYSAEAKADILDYIDKKDTIEGAPHLKPEHLPVFDCAFKAANGTRTIHYMGHLRMMAAVQPFISGAISKTVNMPTEATIEDIMNVYLEAWRMGIKAVAIYRDGSKRQQALTTSKEKDSSNKKKAEAAGGDGRAAPKPLRRRLPDERKALTHKFSVGNYEGYITVGLYDDGTPGEIFVTMAKEGSVISGLMDSFATAVSIGLQYGVPLNVLVNKFVHMRFEPSGYTNNPRIRIAKSITDYIFRWMAMKFLPSEEQTAIGLNVQEAVEAPASEPAAFASKPDAQNAAELNASEAQPKLFDAGKPAASVLTATFDNQSDAPACGTCGSIMVRNGTCYKCLNCGATSGCS